MGEMIEATHFERFAIEMYFTDGSRGSDSDSRQRQTFEPGRNLSARTNAEQQFVFFASVKCLLGRCAGKTWRIHNFRSHPRCKTNPAKVK